MAFPDTSDLSVSRFTAGKSWWFDEGTIILKAFNFKKIRQVIRYRPFSDDGYPRMCLLLRNEAFLTGLLGIEGHQRPGHLSPGQMVDKIFLQSITPFRPVPWDWSPTPGSSQDAIAIAEAIESQSHYQFGTIPFAEIVRVSLGYKTDATEWFLSQHTALCEMITDHLRHHPEEIPLYRGVEKALRLKSPFAHRALMQSLLRVRPENVRNDLLPAKALFEFISRPIQRLFLQPSRTLEVLLDILDVLAIRFQRQYVGVHTMDWSHPFDTELVFLEDYYQLVTPDGLALRLTEKDLALGMPADMRTTQAKNTVPADRSRCIVDNIIGNDELVCQFIDSWNALSNSVWDCCVALPSIVPDLENCVKILILLRNNHSATSMMDGMNKYRISRGAWNFQNNTGEDSNGLNLVYQAKNHSSPREDDDQYPIVPWIQPILYERQQVAK